MLAATELFDVREQHKLEERLDFPAGRGLVGEQGGDVRRLPDLRVDVQNTKLEGDGTVALGAGRGEDGAGADGENGLVQPVLLHHTRMQSGDVLHLIRFGPTLQVVPELLLVLGGRHTCLARGRLGFLAGTSR